MGITKKDNIQRQIGHISAAQIILLHAQSELGWYSETREAAEQIVAMIKKLDGTRGICVRAGKKIPHDTDMFNQR